MARDPNVVLRLIATSNKILEIVFNLDVDSKYLLYTTGIRPPTDAIAIIIICVGVYFI